MSLPLLTTKFYFPPARPSLVPRPRLIERLEVGLRGSLTLISAPAGYGKSTLISEWKAGEGHDYPAALLSLDGDDNDPASFFAYFIAAITTLKLGLGETTLRLLQSSPPLPDRVILASLINELAEIDRSFTLVLDDYHVITNHPIHEAVTYLLDHLPSQMHLVILTRADPPLPLSRLRARNQLVEIRATDLRFNSEEVTEFLKQIMGLSITTDQVNALETRTEGWITGLQLAALSMQGRDDIQNFILAFAGSHHYIVDYLAEEVLNRLPASVREFLLRTSILDRMTAPLCNVLTNRTDGKEILENLEHANLFIIPLDDERRWYRYHHLFLDVLRKQLVQIYPEVIPDLHHQALDWCEQNGLIDQAVDHAFAIKDYHQVVRLFRQYFYQTLSIKYHSQVRRWVKSIPDSVIRNDPWMCVVYAWALWGQGDPDGAEDYLNSGQQALDRWIATDLMPKGDREYDALPSEIPVFRGLICISKGNFERAYELTIQALTLTPEAEYTIRGIVYLNLYFVYREWGEVDKTIDACTRAIPLTKAGGTQGPIIDTLDNLGLMYTLQGQLNRAFKIYQENIDFAKLEWPQETPRSSMFYIHLADIYYEWNDLDQAEHLANEALKLSEPAFRWGRIYARIFLARLERARMNSSKAHQLSEEAGILLRQNKGPLYERELEFYLARVNAELGKIDEIARWVQEVAFEIGDHPGYNQLYSANQFAQILAALDKQDDLLALLSCTEAANSNQGYRYWQIQSLVLQATMWQKKQDTSRALTCLEKALSLAEQEGYVRVFLDAGEAMIVLLQLAAKKGVHLDYVRKLLFAGKRTNLAQPLIEPLSERELEVLHLVADGMSNGQIADKLFIVPGTVKKHINNIFGKLGVQSRTQSVARARELKLL